MDEAGTLLGFEGFKAKLWPLIHDRAASGRFVLVEGARSLGKCSMAERLIFEWSSQAPIRLVPNSLATGYNMEQMREFSSQIQELGLVSSRVGYILDEAHTLSTTCANALLKTLEELPSHVLVFAIALENPPLVATLRSRALKIRVPPQSDLALRRWIEDQPELFKGQEVDLMLHLVQGSPGRVRNFVEKPFQERLKLYQALIEASSYTQASACSDEIDAHVKALETFGALQAFHEWVAQASFYWKLNQLSWGSYCDWQQALSQAVDQLSRSTKLSHVLQALWLKKQAL